MNRIKHFIFVFGIVVLLSPILAVSQENSETTLTEEQQAIQADIEHSLVAPCCWNMTVDQHESGASREVRAKISELVKAGKNKQEMLDYFSAQYGERILASPSQKTLLGKSAYWLIPIALIFGLIVVAKTIRNLSGQPSRKTATKKADPKSEGEKKESPWESKVEDELRNLE